MHSLIRPMALAAVCLLSSLAFAKDAAREVRIERDGRYSIDSFILGGRELVGYLGDLKETEGVTSVVLLRSSGATPEQELKFAGFVADAGLKAFVKRDGRLQELAAE